MSVALGVGAEGGTARVARRAVAGLSRPRSAATAMAARGGQCDVAGRISQRHATQAQVQKPRGQRAGNEGCVWPWLTAARLSPAGSWTVRGAGDDKSCRSRHSKKRWRRGHAGEARRGGGRLWAAVGGCKTLQCLRLCRCAWFWPCLGRRRELSWGRPAPSGRRRILATLCFIPSAANRRRRRRPPNTLDHDSADKGAAAIRSAK